MRSANVSTNAAESRNWCSKWLGSKLTPKPSRWPTASSVRRVVSKSYGDLGRVDLEREAHALGVEHVDDRAPALGEVLVAGAVAVVDRVADGLADQVRGDGPAAEALASKELAMRPHVARLRQRGGDVEVIAPAGELEAVRSPTRRVFRATSATGRSAHWPVIRLTGSCDGPETYGVGR
jgi:hypothetical protein